MKRTCRYKVVTFNLCLLDFEDVVCYYLFLRLSHFSGCYCPCSSGGNIYNEKKKEKLELIQDLRDQELQKEVENMIAGLDEDQQEKLEWLDHVQGPRLPPSSRCSMMSLLRWEWMRKMFKISWTCP